MGLKFGVQDIGVQPEPSASPTEVNGILPLTLMEIGSAYLFILSLHWFLSLVSDMSSNLQCLCQLKLAFPAQQPLTELATISQPMPHAIAPLHAIDKEQNSSGHAVVSRHQ